MEQIHDNLPHIIAQLGAQFITNLSENIMAGASGMLGQLGSGFLEGALTGAGQQQQQPQQDQSPVDDI